MLRRILMDYDWCDDDIAYEKYPYVRDRAGDVQVLKLESTPPHPSVWTRSHKSVVPKMPKHVHVRLK